MVNSTVDLFIQFAIMLVIGTAMAVTFMAVSRLIMPSSKNPNKGRPYECGVLPAGDARAPFNVHYYLVAVLFVLFDVAAVFLYLWAVVLGELGTAALVKMLVFVGLLLVGYVYAWKKGVFEWE